MRPAEFQRWLDAFREYVATAALGVCIETSVAVRTH